MSENLADIIEVDDIRGIKNDFIVGKLRRTRLHVPSDKLSDRAGGQHIGYDDHEYPISIGIMGRKLITIGNIGTTTGLSISSRGDISINTFGKLSLSSQTSGIDITGNVGFQGDINVSNGTFQSVNILGNITDPKHAATKEYVDAVKTGLDVKDSVKAKTTDILNVTNNGSGQGKTLTSNFNGFITDDFALFDNVLLANGDRVLVDDDAFGGPSPHCGIYYITDMGSSTTPWILTRASDTDDTPGGEVTSGLFTYIESGTKYSDNGFVLTTNNPIILDDTPLSFTQFTGAGLIIAGDGISKDGNELYIDKTNAFNPTWEGVHTFSGGLNTIGGDTVNIGSDASGGEINIGTSGNRNINVGSVDSTIVIASDIFELNCTLIDIAAIDGVNIDSDVTITKKLSVSTIEDISGSGLVLNTNVQINENDTLYVNTIQDTSGGELRFNTDVQLNENNMLSVNTITDTSGGEITFGTNINVGDIYELSVNTITDTSGGELTFNTDIQLNENNMLSVNTITDTSGGELTFNTDVQLNENNMLSVNTITDTSGGELTFNTDVQLNENNMLSVNTITDTSGGELIFNTDVQLNENNMLSVNTITDTSGGELIFNTDVQLNENNMLSVNTITDTSGGELTFNTDVQLNGNFEVAGGFQLTGELQTNVIEPISGNLITINGNLLLDNSLYVSNIYSDPSGDTITIYNDIQLNSLVDLTISSDGLLLTDTINSTSDTLITFGNDVKIFGDLEIAGTTLKIDTIVGNNDGQDTVTIDDNLVVTGILSVADLKVGGVVVGEWIEYNISANDNLIIQKVSRAKYTKINNTIIASFNLSFKVTATTGVVSVLTDLPTTAQFDDEDDMMVTNSQAYDPGFNEFQFIRIEISGNDVDPSGNVIDISGNLTTPIIVFRGNFIDRKIYKVIGTIIYESL